MIYGTASMLDGMIDRIQEELGQPVPGHRHRRLVAEGHSLLQAHHHPGPEPAAEGPADFVLQKHQIKKKFSSGKFWVFTKPVSPDIMGAEGAAAPVRKKRMDFANPKKGGESMSRRFAFLLSLALVMAVALTGCGMNKEKAIEQMGQALTDSSVIESGRLTGEISGTISLGEDSIPMELTMEGAFKDQMQTMAMKMSGEVMGNPLDTETYQLDGKTYTLDPTTGGYIESPSATAGMDYQQLMTLGQAEMAQLYIDGATAAEDFAFTEEENGLRVSFTMPTEQLGQMQQQISSLMTDELLPALEEQMRQSVSRTDGRPARKHGRGRSLAGRPGAARRADRPAGADGDGDGAAAV